MTVLRLRPTRSNHADLLARPPCTAGAIGERSDPTPDPVAQLRTLGDLVRSGFVTQEEFERQKAKVFGD